MRIVVYQVFVIGLINIAAFTSNGKALHIGGDKIIIDPLVGRFDHSEGPHWDHRTQKLYFVDIDEQNLCRCDPITRDLTCTYIENGPVGVAVPVRGELNKFVVGTGQDFVLISWNSHINVTRSIPETLAVVDTDRNGTRWNDGKVDSLGRFWGGTIGPEVNAVVVPDQATFYRIGSDLKPKKILSPVTNSNGLAWNLQDDKFYYIDTPTRKIAVFDFEPIDGTISNKRIAFDLEKHNISGLPDGMTIDRNGNLWIALYGGGGVLHVDPRTDRVLKFLKLPVDKVTSCAFGGPLLNILFVTTSSRDLNAEELAKQPYAGYVFAVHGLGVHGLLANSFQLLVLPDARMSELTIEPLAGPYILGEGPHWDQISGTLYFVDIHAKKILRYDPSTSSVKSAYIENGTVGFAIPVDGAPDKLLAGVGTDLMVVTWDGQESLTKCAIQRLASADSDPAETRWNDAKADSSGRLWGGTMCREGDGPFAPDKGSFYSIGADLVLKKQVTPVGISNGVAWSLNDDTLYYIDSLSYRVVAYNYNSRTGTISDKRTVFDLRENNINGLPDGMTIDTNGNLWIAVYGGSGILNVKPSTGELLRYVKIPNAECITSVAFGGTDFETLYVTSSRVGLNDDQLKNQSQAGYLFAVKGLGVRGLPANSFKLTPK
ncbi:uncharacterized protein LOC143359184 [Halictus rubicundus]|uniref:uncharacterized protein LOC143359184 n=1 Tax=Halictus rubicundus TaxID=77578 RepID=UPI004036B3B4